jgi:hypothetical protein
MFKKTATQLNVNLILYKRHEEHPYYFNSEAEEYYIDILTPETTAKITWIIYTEPLNCWHSHDHVYNLTFILKDYPTGPSALWISFY